MSSGGVRTIDLADVKANAEKALRTPDLEWARDLVHGLVHDVLALVKAVEAAQGVQSTHGVPGRFRATWARLDAALAKFSFGGNDPTSESGPS